ncbi:MAG: hypothetical protein H7A46_18025 [Verrucomicrobiales bacterium]|nr:hypothetical protein [Verrucomicrobiales bacterium]
MNEETCQDNVAPETEVEVCFSCLGENVPDTHFCRHCGTPLTSYASTAPFERVFALGDFFRKATASGRWGRWVRVSVAGFVILLLLGLMLP